ncbi:Os09g0535600 [Oryza sativa Japonica Group]|uniref:Os09g0535600 protein n=1 Tax=Oryza sativa subsp. japonica TaxID=39947 RepID=A0A0N7KR64_ORYSJ|nr:Os09g0535600 [Oryza sativa Japonica Group]
MAPAAVGGRGRGGGASFLSLGLSSLHAIDPSLSHLPAAMAEDAPRAAAAAEGSQHASAAERGSAAAPAAPVAKAAEVLLPSLSIWPLSQRTPARSRH